MSFFVSLRLLARESRELVCVNLLDAGKWSQLSICCLPSCPLCFHAEASHCVRSTDRSPRSLQWSRMMDSLEWFLVLELVPTLSHNYIYGSSFGPVGNNSASEDRLLTMEFVDVVVVVTLSFVACACKRRSHGWPRMMSGWSVGVVGTITATATLYHLYYHFKYHSLLLFILWKMMGRAQQYPLTVFFPDGFLDWRTRTTAMRCGTSNNNGCTSIMPRACWPTSVNHSMPLVAFFLPSVSRAPQPILLRDMLTYGCSIKNMNVRSAFHNSPKS